MYFDERRSGKGRKRRKWSEKVRDSLADYVRLFSLRTWLHHVLWQTTMRALEPDDDRRQPCVAMTLCLQTWLHHILWQTTMRALEPDDDRRRPCVAMTLCLQTWFHHVLWQTTMQACQVTLIGSVTHTIHCLHTLTLVSGGFVTYHTHSARAWQKFALWW